MSPLPAVRLAEPDELTLLPALERAADSLFDEVVRGPLPGPGSVEELAAAAVVLVAGDPPVGLCRVDRIGPGDTGLHLEQLSVHPDHGRRGIGRALLRAAVAWARDARADALTLVTYREVPWNGPFYASEGFVELGPAEPWLVRRGLPTEAPVMATGGTRIVMVRRL
jgi:GNAT superfamily N-acetyltransferase